MTHLLDTDHVSIWESQTGPSYAALLANLARHAERDVGVSVVSFQEQMKGCNAFLNQIRNDVHLLKGYEKLYCVIDAFRSFPLVRFDELALRQAERIRHSRIRIATMDLRIAAIALAHNLTLVTRNTRDFELVEGLALEDWTK